MRMHRKLLHAGLIPQYTSLAYIAAGINSQYGKLPAFSNQVHTKRFNEGTFSHTWHTGDAYAQRFSGIRQYLIDQLCRQRLMLRIS
ncbi:hypothetical protein D3C87_1936270 [compost metagenome]